MITVTTDLITNYQGKVQSLASSTYPRDVTDNVRISLDMDQVIPSLISAEADQVELYMVYVQESLDQVTVHEETEMAVLLTDS